MKIKTDFLLPAMVLFSGNCQALEWLFEPDFRASERYDDNITMQANSASVVDSMITSLAPGVLLGYLAADNELKTRFKWNEQIYHDASQFDFAEKQLDLSHQFQAELFKTTLQANYAEESSINTQLEETGSGDLQRLIPRTTKSISPGVTFNIDEINSLELNLSYMDVTFDRGENLRNNYYSDYDNKQAGLTFTHLFTERLSAYLTSSYSIFTSPTDTQGFGAVRAIKVGNNVVTVPDNVRIFAPGVTNSEQVQNTLFYQIGLQYALDEQTQLAVSVGKRDMKTKYTSSTEFNDPSQNNVIINNGLATQVFDPNEIYLTSTDSQSGSTSGNIYSFNGNHNFERGSLNVSALQQLNPSSTGSQQQTTQFSLKGRFDIDARWSTGIDARYQISDSVSSFGGNTLNNNRTYTTITPNVQWRWTPEINLQLSYTYREQIYESNNRTSIGNIVQLQFSYQPQINRQVK